MHEIRSFGYSWLIPLGRLNTQEEDQESSFSSSPAAQRLLSPEIANQQPNQQPHQVGQQAAADHEMAGEQEEDLDAGIEDADDSFGEGSEEEESEDDEEEEEGRFGGSGVASPAGQDDREQSDGSSSPQSVDV